MPEEVWGYAGYIEDITALPSEAAGGLQLSLGDDDYEQVTLGAASVPFYGSNYSSFYVGSNGYVTFGAPDSQYSESLSNHFDTARISAMFDDLNPNQGGTVSWKQFADRVAVTWEDVPQYNAGDRNTFQIEMFFDGQIRLSYLAVGATDGITGLSEGLGQSAGFQETDLSAYSGYDYGYALVGYWKFDNYSGVSVPDSSGNGNTAKLVYGPEWTGSRTVRLDGGDDSVEIAIADLSARNSTVSLWVFPEDTSGVQYLFEHSTDDGGNSIQLYAIGGVLNVSFSGSVSVNLGVIAIDNWSHIVLAWDATSYAVYVNGIEKTNASYTGLTVLDGFADIGNDGRDYKKGFNGIVDDVKVFNRSLSADDVSDLFLTENIKENRSLSLSISSAESEVGASALTYSVYNAQSLPAGAVFDSDSRLLRWKPWYDQAGSYEIMFEGMDENENPQDLQSVKVIVENAEMDGWYSSWLEHVGSL